MIINIDQWESKQKGTKCNNEWTSKTTKLIMDQLNDKDNANWFQRTYQSQLIGINDYFNGPIEVSIMDWMKNILKYSSNITTPATLCNMDASDQYLAK